MGGHVKKVVLGWVKWCLLSVVTVILFFQFHGGPNHRPLSGQRQRSYHGTCNTGTFPSLRQGVYRLIVFPHLGEDYGKITP